MPLDRNFRPAKLRRQDVVLDGSFEMVAMCGYNPIRIVGGFNKFWPYRIARRPQLHGPVINGERAALHFSRRVRGETMSTNHSY
jgi:hypothetical protein